MQEPIASPSTPSVLLSHRPFRFYIIGYFITTFGQLMQSVAVGWEIYERTNSEWALGLVGLFQVIPIFVLALFTGHALDRYNRKTILLLSQVGALWMSLGLGLISYFHWPYRYMYLCLLLGGIARSFYASARVSLLPELLPPSHTTRALNLSAATWQLATTVGPACGGALIAVFHKAWGIYFLSAISAFMFIVLLSKISVKNQPVSTQPLSTEGLFAGVKYVLRTKLLLSVMVLDLFAVLLGGATTLLPVYAKNILRVGPAGLGFLRAAPAVGALIASTIVAYRPPFQKAGCVLLGCVIGFGVATILFGLSRSFFLSMVALLLLGGFDNVSVVIRATIEQQKTPNEMRGRVSAIVRLFINLSNELGSFESGAVAAWIGPAACVTLGGIGTILVVFFVAEIWPELRNLGKLEE